MLAVRTEQTILAETRTASASCFHHPACQLRVSFPWPWNAEVLASSAVKQTAAMAAARVLWTAMAAARVL